MAGDENFNDPISWEPNYAEWWNNGISPWEAIVSADNLKVIGNHLRKSRITQGGDSLKTAEQRSQAWQAFLKQVGKSPVTWTFRGVNDKDQPLYEVKNRKGEVIIEHGTEKEVMDTLRNHGENK